MALRSSPGIAGFPASTEERYAQAGKKCKKQDITVAAAKKFPRRLTTTRQKDLQGKKKAAPGLRTSFSLVRHAGCGQS
jgi:hypothetical protein